MTKSELKVIFSLSRVAPDQCAVVEHTIHHPKAEGSNPVESSISIDCEKTGLSGKPPSFSSD